MAKNSITDYDNISGNNTDVQSVDISEGCSPSGINNAIREVMADLADVNDGTVALTSPQMGSLTVTGNVGIGTSSPSSNLDVLYQGNTSLSGPTTGTWTARVVNQQDSAGYNGLSVQNRWANTNSYIFEAAQGWDGATNGYFPVFTIDGLGQAIFKPQGSEAMRINSSGSVGIGTTSPSVKLDVNGSTTFASQPNVAAKIGVDVTSDVLIGSVNGNTPFIASEGAYPLTFFTNANERMRIDSSGNVLIGRTTTTANTEGGYFTQGGLLFVERDNDTPLLLNRFGGNGFVAQFRRDNVNVGGISVTTSATSYATSSDYRLKENVTDITGATERLKQLNPVRFNFIADADTTVDGFLAHEVQDVVPEAITGTKDAMRDEQYEVTPAVLDDDGNEITPAVMGTRSVPDYQGIDQSKLVPLLVATIQELEARIAALEAN